MNREKEIKMARLRDICAKKTENEVTRERKTREEHIVPSTPSWLQTYPAHLFNT